MLSNLPRRVWHLLNRRRVERELVEEMRDHRARLGDGRPFGDELRLLEASRDAWGWTWLDEGLQDLRHGLRAVRRSPAHAVAGVLILSFGIGVNLTFYQVASIAILRPRPIRSPETLVWLVRHAPHFQSNGMPYAMAAEIERENSVFSGMLMQSGQQVAWGDGDRIVDASFVSANWFDEMGYTAALGRMLAPNLDADGSGRPAVVISYAFWQRVLGQDPAIVGRAVLIDRREAVVVGVAPADFPELELDDTVVWIPITRREYFYPDSDFLRTWTAYNTAVLGRLVPGVSIGAAGESLKTTMAALAEAHPDNLDRDEWVELLSGRDNFVAPVERMRIRTILSLLSALTLLVLVVAAANLGNLALARVIGRMRELGVRMALGAGRFRIVRQLVVEALPIALMGAATAVLLAWWALRVLVATAGLPSYLPLTPDWRMGGVSGALLLIALIVVGVLPAWKVAQHDLIGTIRDGGQQHSSRLDRTIMRRSLILVQVASSCLLLGVAGMMARTAQRALTSDLGFTYTTVAALSASLDRSGTSNDAARTYWTRVEQRVGAYPEAIAAALVLAPPFGGGSSRAHYDEVPDLRTYTLTVQPSYFAVMQIPIVGGRGFAAEDDPTHVVVVSRRLAAAMYGTSDVVGRGFPRSRPDRVIVGVAADAHTMDVTATDATELYAPIGDADYAKAQLLVRARTDAVRLVPILTEAGNADRLVVAHARLLRDDFQRRTRPARIASTVLVSIGTLTLLLACLGILGVVSYGATLRKKELGIRTALGASRVQLLRVVTAQVLAPIAIGVALGGSGAILAGSVLRTAPFYLQPLDPTAYAGPAALFLVVALTAVLIPAIRVLGVDPLTSLRQD